MTWSNVKNNAKKEGRDLDFSKEEFFDWYSTSDERKCGYCSISEMSFTRLEIRNPRGYKIQAIGIDRINSDLGYEMTNICLCCLICNRIKSNLFSGEEMNTMGRALNQIWINRNLV
tara:strand:- start:126 stop:473 length:348 start_codon:yes stop_codon:yes gene_type:complete